MPRTCTVCEHTERKAIDTAIVSSPLPFRDIAGRWGLRRMAVWRHTRRCIPAALAGIAKDRADTLAGLARQALERGLKWEERAEKQWLEAERLEGIAGFEPRDAAIQTGLKTLATSAKVIALLRPVGQVNVNVLVGSPEFAAHTARILAALAAFPEARAAVQAALRSGGDPPMLEAGR